MLGFCACQRFFEVDVGIAFFGNRKRRADLDGGCAPVFQRGFDFFKVRHATGEDERDFFTFKT